ncbi:MAG: hypothetical protein WBG04_19195 [Haloferula sp.]
MAILLSVIAQRAFSNLPEDPAAYSAWEAQRLADIEEASGWPAEKAIPELGKWVGKLSRHHSIERGDRPVFTAAQKTLLAIPGHAEWYGEEIKKLTEAAMPVPGHPNSGFEGHERRWYYATLQQLPSPETVGVLGELIFDERDPWKDGDWGDGGRPMPNSVHATKAFTALGISNPPVRALAYDPGDQRTWQLWFNQVKAGARTFSFEGDDATYSLEGEVPLRSGEGDASKKDITMDPVETAVAKRQEPSRWPVVLTAILALMAAAYMIRRLRTRGRS